MTNGGFATTSPNCSPRTGSNRLPRRQLDVLDAVQRSAETGEAERARVQVEADDVLAVARCKERLGAGAGAEVEGCVHRPAHGQRGERPRRRADLDDVVLAATGLPSGPTRPRVLRTAGARTAHARRRRGRRSARFRRARAGRPARVRRRRSQPARSHAQGRGGRARRGARRRSGRSRSAASPSSSPRPPSSRTSRSTRSSS